MNIIILVIASLIVIAALALHLYTREEFTYHPERVDTRECREILAALKAAFCPDPYGKTTPWDPNYHFPPSWGFNEVERVLHRLERNLGLALGTWDPRSPRAKAKPWQWLWWKSRCEVALKKMRGK